MTIQGQPADPDAAASFPAASVFAVLFVLLRFRFEADMKVSPLNFRSMLKTFTRSEPLRRSAVIMLAITASAGLARGQGTLLPGGGFVGNVGSIIVYVCTETGAPFEGKFQMTATPTMSSMGMSSPVPVSPIEIGGRWTFAGLPAATTYELVVEAKGYQTSTQSIELANINGVTESVIVFLKPIDETLVFHAPGGQFVLSPRVGKEVQKGLKDLRKGKFAPGRKHISKALSGAPENPYVNYVMGMSYLLEKQLKEARPYLEKSVSLDSRNVPALTALGNLRFQAQDYAGAIRMLDAAVGLKPDAWRSQWVLADCYLHAKDYKQALEHAKLSIEAGKEHAEQVELLVGEALAGMGDRIGAINALETFLQQNPKYLHKADIQEWIAELAQPQRETQATSVLAAVSSTRSPNVVAASAVAPSPRDTVPPVTMPVEPPPNPDWAPPDIDLEKPFVVSGAACSLSRVLTAAEKRAEELVNNLQNFTATEEYETVEARHDGWLETPEKHTFSYMVLIDKPRRNFIQVQELRTPPLRPEQMPAGLADMGAPALALIFHPAYRGDYQWSCEGLGEWNGKPAWVLHFTQSATRPTSMLSAFDDGARRVMIPLKGRAWIETGSGEMAHLETDLVRPLKAAGLMKQHFVVDYAAVPFRGRKERVWLPENVDLYLQYKHHYIHYHHHFSHFQLFWVKTSEKDTPPKSADN